MSNAAFASFVQRLGHRAVQTESGWWYDASRFFLLGVPAHELRNPAPEEIRSLLRSGRAAGLRYTAPLEAAGKLSYQIVCDDPRYDLESLSGNTRSKVRRGLRRCEIRPSTAAEARHDGRQAHLDTIGRQDREGLMDGGRWETFWAAVAATPEMEIWAAWTEGRMAAFLVTVAFADRVEFMLARSRNDCLAQYPNNALLYCVTKEMLVERGMREVTFGIESLEPVGPLDEFKFSMGFRAKPLRQVVVFHPVLAAALRPQPVRALVKRCAGMGDGERRPGVFWRKAAGLLRFAEEGGPL